MNFEETIQQLKDAMTVTAAMALRQENRLDEHREWIEANERALARHREWLETHKEAVEAHDRAIARLDEKLDRIADLIMKGHGGNGDAGA
jgi:hypothetical protein